MAIESSTDAKQLQSALRRGVRHHWLLFLLEGLALVALGVAAILAPALASLVATLVFGWVLLLSGIIGLIATLRARHAPGFSWSLLSALIGIAAGVLLLARPLQGLLSLTAVLIVFLFLEGIVSIFYALEHRRSLSGRWGWMLSSGVLDIALGFILVSGLPGTALWALGIIIGINMIFGGWALAAMALAGHSAANRAQP